MGENIESARAFSSEISIAEDFWEEFAAKEAVEFSKEERRKICQYINDYYREHCYQKGAVRANVLKEKIKKITKHCNGLYDQTRDLDILSRISETHEGREVADILDEKYGHRDIFFDPAIDDMVRVLISRGEISSADATIATILAQEAEQFREDEYEGLKYLSNLRDELAQFTEILGNVMDKYAEYEVIGASGDPFLTDLFLRIKDVYQQASGDKTRSKKLTDLILGICNVLTLQYENDFGKDRKPHFTRLNRSQVVQRIRDAPKKLD